ncbi:AAA family ATPase [Nocardioides sp.]|uniref:AAA family ATPase n=1 Tax=Nocardioides sp. TaxID=35761 RepID=UPI0039E43785
MSTVVLIAAAGADWEPAVLALLERHPDTVVLKRCVDVEDLLAAAAAGQADAAVVALDAPGLDAVAVDQLRRAGVAATAIGRLSEPATTRAARIGLSRLLAHDDLDSLPAALTARPETTARQPPAEAPDPVAPPETATEAGRVIAVWGPVGAPGRTTVATGLAAELAHRGLTAVLVDADPYGGTVAQQLGVLDEVSGLLVAARGPGADLTRVARRVGDQLGDRLGVVTGLPRPDRWLEVRAGVVGELAEAGRSGGYVVLDTGFGIEDDGSERCRDRLTLEALDVADDLVVVGTADPVGLTRLARALVDLRELTAAPPTVCVNRMRASLGWSEREVARMIAEVARTAGIHFLPEDRAVDRALIAGRSLVETAPESPLARALGRLADDFASPSLGRRAASRGVGQLVRRRRAGRDRRR